MSDQYQKYLHVKVSINGNELNSYCFDDSKAKVNIGRGSDCQVVLDNPGISRVHATIQREGDNIRIFDMESGNGTFVNGNAVEKAWISSSDTLRIGKFTLNARLSALRGNTTESDDEETAISSVTSSDKTVSLSADDRKKILQQAQAMRANVKAAPTKGSMNFLGVPFVLLFVAGTVFGLFVSWLFGG